MKQPRIKQIVTTTGVIWILGVLFLLPVNTIGAQIAQTPTPEISVEYQYFSITGHNVRGEFLAFFQAHGGLDVFGYPITEQFNDPRLGRTVQYFQNMRLEFWPENPTAYRIQPGLINDQFNRGQPADMTNNTNTECYMFTITGHSVCYAFLDYFRAYGGIDVFGYPVDEFRVVNARIVQHFQRATLEWHPERPVGQRVQPASIGLEWFDFAGYTTSLTEPAIPISPGDMMNTELRVQPSVSEPVIRRGHDQTLYLVVTNQLNQPVAGATATIVVHFSSGPAQYTMPATDQNGLTQFTFSVDDSTPGQTVWIEVSVSHDSLTTTEQISILPWW